MVRLLLSFRFESLANVKRLGNSDDCVEVSSVPEDERRSDLIGSTLIGLCRIRAGASPRLPMTN